MAENGEDAIRASDRESGQRELKSSGVGAVGGGRGADGPALPLREPESEAEARQGPIADEHMREGWGGPGEPYAPTQGPNGREDGEGETWEDRRFREGRPPAGAG